MNCCLWLNGLKVKHADNIKNNFDLASLRSYFVGGSLVRWLEANGGEKQAAKLLETEYNSDINERIKYAFEFSERPVKKLTISNEPQSISPPVGSAFIYSRSSSESFGSYAGSGSYTESGSGLSGGYGLHII